MTVKTKTGGLAGIVAGDSSICLCSADDESLLYRGYDIQDLAAHASFEETAFLLTRGYLPSQDELESYRQQLATLRILPATLTKELELIPQKSNMMDVLRSGVSLLGNIEPETAEHKDVKIADRLLACLPSILLYWHHFHFNGTRINLNTNESSHAGHILHLLTGKSPIESKRRCLDVSLILYAEHEFNASTFTVKTIASTLSDFYSAICGGIGALRGPLHGGANEKAWELITQYTNKEEAAKGIHKKLSQKELIMGFGHRVYTTRDPRSDIIKKWATLLSEEAGSLKTIQVAETIDETMASEKKLFPNLDFYSSIAYHFCGFPTEMFTPLFVFSRITGWSAHLLEQRQNNKLIRPISNYTGPSPKPWKPIQSR